VGKKLKRNQGRKRSDSVGLDRKGGSRSSPIQKLRPGGHRYGAVEEQKRGGLKESTPKVEGKGWDCLILRSDFAKGKEKNVSHKKEKGQ